MKKDNIILALVILIIGILYFFQIIDIPCMFNEITHLYCPGCGITRALRSLVHLDFYQAFRYNNLIYILIVVLGIYFIEIILNKYKIKNLNLIRFYNKLWTCLIVVLIVYGILRNIPFFDYLKPTVV